MLANGAVLGRNGRVRIAVSNLQDVLIKHRRSQQGSGWQRRPGGKRGWKGSERNRPAPDGCHGLWEEHSSSWGGQRWLREEISVAEPLRALTGLTCPNQPHLGPHPHPLLMDQGLCVNSGLKPCCGFVCLQPHLLLGLPKCPLP